MEYFIIAYLAICTLYVYGAHLTYPEENLLNPLAFIVVILLFLPVFIYSNIKKTKMKNSLLLLFLLVGLTASAQTEKVKIKLKHTLSLSEMFAAAQDSSDGQLNTELNYLIGGKDFNAGFSLRTDSKWENISVGITTTTRIFTVNDMIKFAGTLGAGVLVVNEANPHVKAGYVEVGIEYSYKLSEGWVAGTYFKEWFYTRKATPVGGLVLSHTF